MIADLDSTCAIIPRVSCLLVFVAILDVHRDVGVGKRGDAQVERDVLTAPIATAASDMVGGQYSLGLSRRQESLV